MMRKCPFCAEEIQDAAIVCKHCHKDLVRERPSVPVADRPVPDGAFSKDHYRRAFATFEQNDRRFKPSWNWGALFFGCLWYLYRGMWAKGGLLFLAILVTAGVGILPGAIYAGVAGDYDFYLLWRDNKQLW